jgi:hypothetical protein
MHPLAHLLTGALVGQVASTPVVALLGGFTSHLVLDALPHTEGETFGLHLRQGPRWDLIEAGLELIAGAGYLAWSIRACPGVLPVPVVLGATAALLPDVVDVPLDALRKRVALHPLRLHWTVERRHWVWGVLTQIAVAAAAGILLWQLGDCGALGR